MKISIIIPVYNSEKSLKHLYNEIKNLFSINSKYKNNLFVEVIFLNDSSKDNSLSVLKEIIKENKNTKKNIDIIVIDLIKNINQQNALCVGLNYSRGDYIVTLDDDLKNKPSDIFKLLNKLENNKLDVVYGISKAKTKKYRSLGSKLTAKFFKTISKNKELRVSSFRIMKKEVINEIILYNNVYNYKNKYLSAIIIKLSKKNNYKIGYISLKSSEKVYRKSNYNFISLILVFLRLVFNYSNESLFMKRLIKGDFRNYSNSLINSVQSNRTIVQILGGGQLQTNIINYINSSDKCFISVLSDIYDMPINRYNARFFKKADTFDIEKTKIVSEIFGVDLIITSSTDQPIRTLTNISNELNLNTFLDNKTALIATNKMYMKEFFINESIPTVNYLILDKDLRVYKNTFNEFKTFEEFILFRKKDETQFVLKPFDSQGQRGVYFVDKKEDIISMDIQNDVLRYSKDDKFLLEEYVSYDEVTVTGWVIDSKLKVFFITDRISFDETDNLGICIAHRYPTKYSHRYKEIVDLTEQIKNKLKLKNSPIYFQYLINDTDILVNEIALRIGGAYEDITFNTLYNKNLYELYLNHLINLNSSKYLHELYFNISNLEPKNYYIGLDFIFLKAGIISYVVDKNKILELDFVLDYGFNYKVGDVIGNIENATSRAGFFIIKANNKEEFYKFLKKVYTLLEILDENEKDMVINNDE